MSTPIAKTTRVVTVEDDPRYRASLAALVGCVSGLVLSASHAAAEPLLAEARKLHKLGMDAPWDVVLTDLNLPGIDGIALTRELKQLFPQIEIIVLTVFEEPASVLAAICAGASGYLVKSSSVEEITVQITTLGLRGAPLSASVAHTLLQLVRANGHPQFFSGVPRDLGLTRRQTEVLRALVDGLSYQQIGTRLEISVDTVRSHIRQIYAALQVHSVAEAVTYALRHGIA